MDCGLPNLLQYINLYSIDGSLSTVETLASTAICGILHSILGGQPLLVVGVAEPTIIMYTYLYNFCKDRKDIGRDLFLAWAGWWAINLNYICKGFGMAQYWLLFYRVCVWTALLLFLLAIFNASRLINRFTRIAGELFGMLISVLFIQEAIKVGMNFFLVTQEVVQKLSILFVGVNLFSTMIQGDNSLRFETWMNNVAFFPFFFTNGSILNHSGSGERI